MATAGELTVHETSLDGESTSREAFIEAGDGSAFVPRLGEVVHVRCTAGGLDDLQAKTEQLIDKGLHTIVVSLEGVPAGASLGALCDAHAHVERFLGWLCVCGLSGALRERADGLAAERELELVHAADLAEALELLKVRDEPPPSESGDVEASNEWGWSSEDVEEPAEDPALAGLPEVDVAELFVEADELPQLREQLAEVMGRGRVHVTLRVHVPRGRRMQSEDVSALSAARDLLEGAGGQLILVSLQAEFLQWLRLLDEAQHFQIVETAVDAERLHREHAAEGVAMLGPSLQLVSAAGDRFVVRAPEGEQAEGEAILTGRLIELEPAGLSGLGPRIHALAEEGVQDVVVDLSRFQGVEGVRFEPVVGAVAAARARGVRLEFAGVSHEIDALLKLLHVDDGLLHANEGDAALALAGEVYLRAPFAEATLALAREPLRQAPAHDDPVSTIEFASEVGELVAPGDDADEELASLRTQLAQSQGELARLREAVEAREKQAQDGAAAEREFLASEQARRRAEARVEELEQELEAQRAAAEGQQADGARVEELEQALEAQRAEAEAQGAALAERERRIEELEQAGAQAVDDLAAARQQLEQARSTPTPAPSGSNGDGDGDADERVRALELEKARILTEAEQEIQRLLRHQRQLREELESAGDMIERLGKELELS